MSNITPLFGSEERTVETQKKINELASIGAKIRGGEEVAFSTDLDKTTAEVRAGQLVVTKDAGEAELSYTLWLLKDQKAYLDAGYESFNDYVESKIKFSSSKASSLASRWEAFLAMGLAPNVLAGPSAISWSKFGELVPGIKHGVIDDSTIDTWLPFIVNDGPYMLPNSGIIKMVKSAIAETAAEDDPNKLEKLTVSMTADDKEHALRYINTIEEATGVLGAGEVLRMALESKVTEIAEDSEDVRQNYGLTRLKNIAERMVPGIEVVFLATDGAGYTEEGLGVVPYTRVYRSNVDPDQFLLAASLEEAQEALGTNISIFPLKISGIPETGEYSTDDDTGDLEAEDEAYEEHEDEYEELEDDEEYEDDDELEEEEEEEIITTPSRVDYNSKTAAEISSYNKDLATELVKGKYMTKEELGQIQKIVKSKPDLDTHSKAKWMNQQLIMIAESNGVNVG
jgi:hypothetical protein